MKTFNHLIKKTALFVALFIAFNSSYGGYNMSGELNNADSLYEQKSNLKKEFARALLKAMKESKMLRYVLKTEALRMFDKDYDVLYVLIKDKTLENGKSVESLIAKHLGGIEKLNHILSINPTLTILVPELPNESFSAELWDTENDIPAVAIPSTSSAIPFIRVDGTEDTVPEERIPGFPILVIKDNERVVVASNSSSETNSRSVRGFKQLETRNDVYNDGEIRLEFWDKAFDNSVKKSIPRAFSRSNSQSEYTTNYFTVREAYNTYKENPNNGWQRDYIYYGIDHDNATGPFKYNYMEYITTFSLAGDPMYAFNGISDQGHDSKLVREKSGINGSSWTEGYYEFRIIVNVDSNLDKVIDAKPDQLFELTYERAGNYYKISNISLKTMSVYLPLFKWDLNKYSYEVKITIEEVDPGETYTYTEVLTVGYATNFDRYQEKNKEVEDGNSDIILHEGDNDEDRSEHRDEHHNENYNEHQNERHDEYIKNSGGYSGYSNGSIIAHKRGYKKYEEQRLHHIEGYMEKVGAKFGRSDRESKTINHIVSYTKGSDPLYEAIVNFGDQILIKDGHAVREYSTGLCKFKIMPIKIN